MRGHWSLATSLLIPIGPAYFGVFYLGVHGSMVFAIAGVAITVALIFMTILTIRNNRPWIALLTHVAVFLYWFIGLVLIAAGD